MMFFRKRSRKVARQSPAYEDELPYRSSLAKFDGDLSLFRFNAVAMKVWLPEAIDEILKQLADHGLFSRSQIIRDALFLYLYGQYAFAQMKTERDGFFYVHADQDGPRYARMRGPISALGKNIKSYKVWMPAKLHDDLKVMAEADGMTLSHYVREILISFFMGHLNQPSREAVSRQAEDKPDDWPPDEDNSREPM